jgi:hypothetical protein
MGARRAVDHDLLCSPNLVMRFLKVGSSVRYPQEESARTANSVQTTASEGWWISPWGIEPTSSAPSEYPDRFTRLMGLITNNDFQCSMYTVSDEGSGVPTQPSSLREEGVNMLPLFPVAGFSLIPSSEEQAHPNNRWNPHGGLGKGGDEYKFPYSLKHKEFRPFVGHFGA